jgi:hydrogenase maturation protein HypF
VLHDREIEMPCEDTVMRVLGDDLVTTRRSWGQAPSPIVLQEKIPAILALGPTHRGTLALGYERWIVLSQHLGDLDRPAGQRQYRQTLEHLSRLHRFEPELLALDGHPRGLGRRLAKEMDLPVEVVQHHHAHVASVMAEHGLQGPVLGLALDQSGWGEDDTLWGSEFLVGDVGEMQRVEHGPEFCLPGGPSVMLHPWRTAAGLLWELKGEEVCADWLEENAPDPVAGRTVAKELRDGVNCVRACGLGLLYDALAAIVGILDNSSFEGQAPMSLERLAGTPRELELNGLPDPEMPTPEYFAVVLDRLLFAERGSSDARLNATYIQKAVARWVARRAVDIAREHRLDRVLASGGCLLNAWLRQELRTTRSWWPRTASIEPSGTFFFRSHFKRKSLYSCARLSRARGRGERTRRGSVWTIVRICKGLAEKPFHPCFPIHG